MGESPIGTLFPYPIDRAVSKQLAGAGATDPEPMIGRSDLSSLLVEHQDVVELLTVR